jgi:hypothetical protein
VRRRRVPNIVPPLVLSATFVGVVPACALVSCGSSPDQGVFIGGDVAADAFGWKDTIQPMYDVACCIGETSLGVADASFDVTDEPPSDAADEADDADDGEGGRDG